MKARVSNKRNQEETEHVENIRRIVGQNSTPRQRKKKYFSIDAESIHFTKLVHDTHEAVQVIHHAYVYDFATVLLLVGNNAGAIMYGIFVNVSEELRTAYGDVLGDIYSRTLQWLYDDTTAAPEEKDLNAVFDCLIVNKAPLDDYCFRMDVALWKDVIRNFVFPISKLARIIPLVYSMWNGLKGGSDATTQLIWKCNYNVLSDENQSNAVARMLSLAGVHIHRLEQLRSANRDLSVYPTLKRYRDSASQRRSFKTSLNMIIDNILSRFQPQEQEEVSQAPVTVTPRGPQPITPPRATRSEANVERLSIPMVKTNQTPKRNFTKKLEQLEGKLMSGSGRLEVQSKLVIKRTKECTGFQVKRVGATAPNGKGSRNACAICGSPTHSYCLQCKRSLCDKASEKA